MYVLTVALYSLLSPLACGDQDRRQEFRATIDKFFTHYSEPQRASLADSLHRSIVWDRWPVEKHSRIIRLVSNQIQIAMEATAWPQDMARTYERIVHNTPAEGMVSFPAEFRARAEAVALRTSRAVIEEFINPGPPADGSLQRMRLQLQQLKEIVLGEARRVIKGDFADAVIRWTALGFLEDREQRLGDVLRGSVNRPLTDVEFERIATAIRDVGRRMPVTVASSDPECEHGVSSEEVYGSNGTRAGIAAGSELYSVLVMWNHLCYPKTREAEAELSAFKREMMEWRQRTDSDIRQVLQPYEEAGAAKMKRLLAELERPREPEADTGHTANAPEAPSSTPNDVSSAAAKRGTWPQWVTGALMLLLLAVVLRLAVRSRG